MKIPFKISIISCLALGLTACATPYPVGGLWTNVSLPVTATSNHGAATKVGQSTCKSYFALFSVGDCSIDSAKKNGGVTKVDHVDWHSTNFLGIVGTYTVQVYGE
ncbi:MAG: TRL-like family protein [Methylomonas sp.]|jgi:hypothetical protein